MHRIDGDGHVDGMFDPGDPFAARPATQLTTDWCNAVQEELVNVIQTQGGVTLSKPDNGQLWAALVARFGRLGSANTWSAAQTFTGAVTANGNVTLGDSTADALTINSTTTVNGPLTVNALVAINDGGNTLQLKPGTEDHTFIEFYARTASPTVRSAFLGYAATAATKLSVVNQIAGGNVEILPGTGGKVTTSGNIEITAAAPASTTAFQNTITPANITKAWAVVTITNGVVSLADGFNIASVTDFGSAPSGVTITFAQPFANANYAITAFGTAVGETFTEYSTSTTAASIVADINGTQTNLMGAGVNRKLRFTFTGRQ